MTTEIRHPTFVLFSGHNDRAVVTLCRFFRATDRPFVIVAAGRDDAIHHTDYAGAVIFDRLDKTLTVDWFAALAQAVGGRAVHCPTTEFVNDFVLAHREAIEAAGWIVGLPGRAVYERLTSKLDSQGVVARLVDIQAPPAQRLDALRAPCVLKPRVNVRAGRVLYPLLCPDDATLRRARAEHDLDESTWFAQAWVDGQSRYLCAYLALDGRRAWFWQDNLLQQPDGKSIVLARTSPRAAFAADAFLDGLHALGYHGPLMLEVIEDAGGRLHYIEINPRFWGPLQLALKACPDVLALFAEDQGSPAARLAPLEVAGDAHYYAWAHGAGTPGCRHYPAADLVGNPIGNERELRRLLTHHDVYAAADTAALRGRH